MIKFTIVSKTNYRDINRREDWIRFFPKYNERSFRTILCGNNDPLRQAINTLEAKNSKNSQEESGSVANVTRIHPNSTNLSTLSIWKREGEDNIYYVKDIEDLVPFNREKNLLYLPALRGETLIDFIDRDNTQTYRYRLVEPQDEKLGFPDSLASKTSDINGAFFEQIKKDEGIDPKIVYIEHDRDITEDGVNGYFIVGWLNPFILTISLDGDHLQDIINPQEDGYLSALNLFFDRSALLLVEPHIDASYDLRIAFLIKLALIIREKSQVNDRQLSPIEYIMFGSKKNLNWKPFFILDLLGGKFYVKQNVSQQDIEIQLENKEPIVDWKLPQAAGANQRWFANYWLEQWINTQEIDIDESEVNVVPSPEAARKIRSSRGSITVQIDNVSENISLTSILTRHPGFVSDSETIDLYSFVVKLFQEYPLEKSLPQFSYQIVGSSDQHNTKLIKFDDVAFWNNFSKRHFAPESPILIQIPQQKNRFLDPVASIRLGCYHFLWEFFNAIAIDRKEKNRKFENIIGWWNEWHSTIFHDRYDIWLRFVNRRGFILKISRLAEDYLGQKVRRIDWEDPNMRFSRSLRR